jgi:hypothetical protein
LEEVVGLGVAEVARDYVQLYRGDREALAASLDRTQRAAAMILSAIAPRMIDRRILSFSCDSPKTSLNPLDYLR